MQVWGGGLWYHDAVYDAADEMGLLMYHDAMYGQPWFGGNSGVAVDNAMQEAEIRYQLRRLGHHPCLALLDACNEVRCCILLLPAACCCCCLLLLLLLLPAAAAAAAACCCRQREPELSALLLLVAEYRYAPMLPACLPACLPLLPQGRMPQITRRSLTSA